MRQQFDLQVDAVFGFSFDAKREIRAPYKELLDVMAHTQTDTPVVPIIGNI